MVGGCRGWAQTTNDRQEEPKEPKEPKKSRKREKRQRKKKRANEGDGDLALFKAKKPMRRGMLR